MNNPKGAATIDDLEGKLEEWNTNCRLMVENGGEMPTDETLRMAFIEMLPAEVIAYVTIRLDEPDFNTYSKVKNGH